MLNDPDTVAPRSALSQPDLVGPQSDPSDPDTGAAAEDSAHGGGGLQTNASDRFEVVVTFNQPVVDFTADSPSLRARGVTVAAGGARTAGAAANSYIVTLARTDETDEATVRGRS